MPRGISDKRCKGCGVRMYQVAASRKLCEACAQLPRICPACGVRPLGSHQRVCDGCRKPRGGNHGGGTTVKVVELTAKAAALVKASATIAGTRYTKAEANATASAILEAMADRKLILITPDMRAALPWLEEASRICISEDAQRGLDQLIAALWTSAA